MTQLGLRADLTLVFASVTWLNILDLQCPCVGCLHEEGLEPLVRDERVAVHSEDVSVPSADP